MGVTGLSPMRAKKYLGKETSLKDSYASHPLSTPKGIVTRDRWDATRADIVLVNVLGATRVSIGTMMELGWADAYRVPIVLVMESSGNPHDHGMVREVAGFVVPTLDEALAIVKALLPPED